MIGKRALSVTVAAVAMALGGQAFAAGPASSPMPATNWSGLYAGFHGGLASGTTTSCVTTNDFVNFFGHYTCNMWTGEPSLSGGYVGVQFGYNWLMQNNLVLGAEADLSGGGPTGSGHETFSPGFGLHVHSTGNYSIDWLATVRGRLGVVMGDWMPYVTGGAAFAGATRSTNVNGPTLSAPPPSTPAGR